MAFSGPLGRPQGFQGPPQPAPKATESHLKPPKGTPRVAKSTPGAVRGAPESSQGLSEGSQGVIQCPPTKGLQPQLLMQPAECAERLKFAGPFAQ
jgi:hypothetical protein